MHEIIHEMMETNPPEMKWLRLLHRLGNLRLSEVPRGNFDLSFSQIDILRFVGQNPGCHLQDVAEAVGLTPPSVSVSIRRLEDEDWLERRSDPNDGRATCIYVTDKSKNALKAALNNQMGIIKIFLEELSTEEQDQLLSLMEKAISGMEQHRQTGQKQAR